MKKSNPHKLTVHRETIRALATLELAKIVGGDPALLEPSYTCKVNCTVSAAIKPPGNA